ncbi:PAS domain-containing protein [Streptomyces halobius]|uniref:PAS domain-containing protein n=1 Tax=Streptomyces halobius TaxID=2879846 RepID=A0ABY4M3B7_9ACTN|nr:PAS domain-containing protein [Streptomyces halobius]UQA91713.1 PAS domain-containing protein [Streptomyces halobius]
MADGTAGEGAAGASRARGAAGPVGPPGGDGPGGPPDPAGPYAAGPWRNYFLILLDRIPTPIAVCHADGEVLIANPAMAAQWGAAPGRLRGRNLLDLFRPRAKEQLHRIAEAVRLGHRSRYPVEVHWRSASDGSEREGELTVDPVGDPSVRPPALLALLRVRDTAPPPAPRDTASPVEARILALAAGGATTASIGTALGLTVDGVNYHLTRLARRWRVQGRTALVARAYVLGVLAPDRWPPAPA